MNECATELRTLLHPARKLPRHSRTEAGEPDRFEQHFRPLALLSPLSALLASERFDNLERQEHIVAYRAPGQQCRILEGHADALQWPRDLFPPTFTLPRVGRTNSSRIVYADSWAQLHRSCRLRGRWFG